MLDAPLRRALARPLDALARAIDVRWITPDGLTLTGLGVGLASALGAALQWWALALVLWLVSRVIDGLDGTLARRRKALATAGMSDAASTRSSDAASAAASGVASSTGPSEAGGFLDITADFVVYGATVLGVAVGASAGFNAPWWPFLLVMLAYYLNGSAFLAFSSIAERTGRRIDDGRSLSFLGRIAEGTETIVVHSLWLIVPFWAGQIAVIWGAIVLFSAAQRIVVGYRSLR